MSKYFSLTDAWKEMKSSDGAADKATSIAKFVGKTFSNAVVCGVTEIIPRMIKSNAEENVRKTEELLKKDDFEIGEREKLEDLNLKSKAYLATVNKKEKEREDFERDRRLSGDEL